MKKLVVFFAVICIIWFPINASAVEQESGNNSSSLNQTREDELKKFDLSPLDELRKQSEVNEMLGNKSVKEIIMDFATGKNSINSETITDYLFVSLITGIKEGLVNLSFILFTVIMCGALKSMSSNSLGDISNICDYVCFIVVVYMLLGTFVYYIGMTRELIGHMQAFVRVIFPPLLTLMTAIGGISSASVFQPAMAVLSGSMVEFMGNGIMPIGILGGVTGILGGISSRLSLEKLSDFCNSLCKWLMGIAFTVYAGILSIQGMMAATYDGIYIRTAKYTVDSFMPILGGMMSDTVDTVLGCSLLLKNAIGFTGLLIIAAICLLPLMRYITCILSYKLLGALIDTASDSRTAGAVEGLGAAITMMFAIVCVIAAMTFITIALAVNAGNTNIMLR